MTITSRRPAALAGSAVAALVAALLAMALAAGTAGASSSGCVSISNGNTCFYINGPGGTAYVTSFGQSRDLYSVWPIGAICNYQTHFTVTTSYGTRDFD